VARNFVSGYKMLVNIIWRLQKVNI